MVTGILSGRGDGAVGADGRAVAQQRVNPNSNTNAAASRSSGSGRKIGNIDQLESRPAGANECD
jgi:hypothetical protein